MIKGKKQFILFHAAGILCFICLPLLFLSNGPENTGILPLISSIWFWIFTVTYAGIFYLNAYWLFPKLYLKKEYPVYFIIILLLLAAVYFIQPFDHIISLNGAPRQMPPGNFNEGGFGPAPNKPSPGSKHFDFVSIFLFFTVLALSTIVPLVTQWQKTQQQFITAQKDKAKAELYFLKAQINPHFLFNTLNNLYSLSLSNSEKTPDGILRLSNIMRYVTDEVHNDLVPLENEIACISDFIELQKLRLNNKTTVNFTCTGADVNLAIAPLILLPFVENIFKHGISNNESSSIAINIAAKNKEVIFNCSNNIFNPTKNKSRQGTGIENVTKRLQNLYPNKHFLKIEADEKKFEVHLIINTAV
jgi:two-component system, LytTR family, sensor kinase